MRFLFLICFLVFNSFAFAQQVVQPLGVTTQNGSGTIAVTNTFQSIFVASTATRGRSSCTVQNNGTHTMYVFFGPIASADKAKSVQLSAGQSVTCVSGISVLKDQVSITGTATDEFYAAQQ